MASSAETSKKIVGRQERFRAFMRRFNPTAPPRQCISDDLVVEEPSGLAAKMAVRADLEPGSQQLVPGGIGSGKTTLLLVTERQFSREDKTLPFYIDVSSETDLARFNTGAVLASFGLHIARRIQENPDTSAAFDAECDQIKTFAFGKAEEVWVPNYHDYPPDYDDYRPDDEDRPPDYDPEDHEPGYYLTRKVPGKLRPLLPLFPPLDRDLEEISKPLLRLADALRTEGTVLIAILDGLDRLMAPEKFWEVVHQDFQVMRSLQISVVAAAPLTVLFGTARPISDYFDAVHHLPVHDPTVSEFPIRVLEKRGARDLMERPQMDALCKGSGGVLRDLISLVRNAAAEAYLSGCERIEETHVARVVRELGESYFLGLGDEHVRVLRVLNSRGAFAIDNDLARELLVTRRVLEYSEPQPRYQVHPALKQRLDAIGE